MIDSKMHVTRHSTAEAFLDVAQPLLMMAEAENNLILGVVQGIARNPSAAINPYLATVEDETGVLACAVHIAPFKMVITRANQEPIAALARDIYEVMPGLDGVIGPSRSADDFSIAWSKLSGVEPVLGIRLRIHETRKVTDAELTPASGTLRRAGPADLDLLAKWAEVFLAEARITEPADPSRIVEDAINRGRLHVWDNAGPVSMAAWAGKTPNGVRINFVYTPRELRGNGYATACVKALTTRQLEQGNAFCWLYTNLSGGASPRLFKRIGYWPVSDVSQYDLRQARSRS